MAEVSFAERKITLRLVWYGAPQSGCGTNVRQLHRLLALPDKSDLQRVGGKDRTERSWAFTFEPEAPPALSDFRVLVQCISVPGTDDSSLDRDDLLDGVDGIAFVADARANRAPANIAAILELERLLSRQGLALGDLPLVFEINQTDAANARPSARVLEDIDPVGLPWFESMARQGKGVLEVLDILLAAVVGRVQERMVQQPAMLTLTATHEAERDRALAAIAKHVDSLARRPSGAGSPLLPPVAEILLRPTALRELIPTRHLRTEVVGERLRVEATFRNPEGDLRKLAVLLEPGADAPAEPRPERIADTPARRPFVLDDGDGDGIAGEMSRLAYGLIGIAGGAICGVLATMLWFG